MAIRVHSGGHSYEGQSYTVDGAVLEDGAPFVVIDLMSLNRVRVDAASATTWVECGATLSKVYYAGAASSVSSSSMVNGSSSSLAFTAGLCSTVSVGGHISGSGFGLLLRKFMLTVDNKNVLDAEGRVLDQGAMGKDVFWAIRSGSRGSWGVVIFLVVNLRFPELDLVEMELSEMSWVKSAMQFARLSSVEELTSRVSKMKYYGTNKSDYVKQPIQRDALAEILRYLSTGPVGYSVQYGITWKAGKDDGEAGMTWLRTLYEYMALHVSYDPRAAYVNYIDLDLSMEVAPATTTNASVLANFDRLVQAKTHIDPANVFNNAQSIPPLERHD
ncbi:hypothetical protein SETIT_6G118600v2 [Setaria italica]|uniref:FAD-binding PCMH-type domain-containing protein n=1 Tax=Setaria italica TaxID=4555 RepID=A0A368RMB2_SETIT|nr:hypothetical protein SETIT_6G118600v2 [Setaria italica]